MPIFDKIKSVKAKIISNSKGKKAVEVKLSTELGAFFSSVASGTSKSKKEAVELSAEKAVENVNKIIAPKLFGKNPIKQKEIDNLLIKLDGSKNKKNLGVNAILPVSIAVLRAGAKNKRLALFKYISQVAKTFPKIPKPSVLLVEGGLHAKTKLDFQEFMVIPEGETFSEIFSNAKKIYKNLKLILRERFGRNGIKIGLEGGFTPNLAEPEDVLPYIIASAKGYKIGIGLDISASNIKKGKYKADFYKKLIRNYPILFLEDPFGEEDWDLWKKLILELKTLKSKPLIVGDDLTATNHERIKRAHSLRACDAVVIKPNQVGTVTETIRAVKLAKSYGWKIMVSHRSGETMDDFISDLAVGVGADFIKAGAPSKPERMVKYKRLLEIEKELRFS